MNNPKDDDIIARELTETELEGVDGGITLDNGIKRAARVEGFTVDLYGNDTLESVTNDTLEGFSATSFKRKL